ncbi:MAG TPA: DUF4956 domain-containing protein [Clostridiaceae bacterium]|nr:DUF4956 domain-containing protein [Clostridiaceae bacterium]
MTFTDILKSSFLEKVAEFSIIDAGIALGGAFLLGMFIYMIYRKTFSGVMYSKPFNTSLVLLTMLTTFIILAVTSNVVLSLGMVGALSIVRFRTAIKDPLDLVFLFWALGGGIVLGAGMLPLAIMGSLLIGGVLLGFVSRTEHDSPYILMVDVDGEIAEVSASDLLKHRFDRIRLKSKTITSGDIELIYEVRLKDNDTTFINKLSALKGVRNATLVSYNGDYTA